jgi:hypothetical protein
MTPAPALEGGKSGLFRLHHSLLNLVNHSLLNFRYIVKKFFRSRLRSWNEACLPFPPILGIMGKARRPK